MHTPATPGPAGDETRDRSLLRRAQRGEAAALAELMRHHLPRAWRVCLALTLDRDEAEALLIEVARTFWSETLARGPALDALTAIARLARAKAAMSTRRRAGEPGGALSAARPDGRAFGEASPYDADYERRLLAVFASWSSEDRLLLALRAFERMPLAEVARALGLGATEPAERMAGLRVRLEAAMVGEDPKGASGEHLSPLLLSASLDGSFAGALKDDGHEIVTRHLSTCATCRDLSARLRRHEEGLRRLLAFDPGAAYLDDLGRYLDQLIDAVAAGRHLPLRRVRAEVVEPAVPAAEVAPEAPPAPALEAAAAAPTPAPAPAPAPTEDVHATLDALMAQLGKGFETPRTVARAPVEPPRTAAEVMKPPSREMPRPPSRELPRPAARESAPTAAAAPAPAPEAPAPTPVPARTGAADTSPPPRASDAFDASLVRAHRARSPEPDPAPPRETIAPPRPPLAAERPTSAPSPSADRRSPPRALVLALAGALIVVIALYVMPPVIRVSVPEMPAPRLPRIEVVRNESRTPAERVSAPSSRRPAASPQAQAAPAPAAMAAPARTESSARPSRTPSRETPSTPAATTPARRPDARVSPPHEPAESAVLPPATIATAAPVTPSATASTDSAPRATDVEEDWPLLCGEVKDENGEPVAGARVLLADLDLGARTDRRGRFCIAAPMGDRTLTVSAQGFATTRQLVSLGRSTAELSLTLRTGP